MTKKYIFLDVKRYAMLAMAPILVLGFSENVLAQTSTVYQACNALVTGVGTSTNGSLQVTFAGMGTPSLCNMNSSTTISSGTVTPAECQAMLAYFLTARTSGQPVWLYFAFTLATGSSAPACTAIPSFSWQVLPGGSYPYSFFY